MSDFPESEEYPDVACSFGGEPGYLDVVMPIMLVAFAALCIWLAIRIINRRERWAKWTMAGVVLAPILYYASCGPALWISLKAGKPEWTDPVITHGYAPVLWAAASSNELHDWHMEYVGWWMELAADKSFWHDTPNNSVPSPAD